MTLRGRMLENSELFGGRRRRRFERSELSGGRRRRRSNESVVGLERGVVSLHL